MCELVIRVKDSELIGDPVFDSKVTRRGDVIQVFEDGFFQPTDSPTAMVHLHEFWRILKLPNVPYAVGKTLEAEEPLAHPLHRTAHMRMHSFDLEHSSFSAELRAYLEDDTRKEAFFTLNTTASEFAALFSRKPPIPDPGSM